VPNPAERDWLSAILGARIASGEISDICHTDGG
jgi:hypothetical protein